MDPSYSVTGVGCWSGEARVKRRHLRSGRASAPARRSGRVSSRHDPSDDQVSFVVDFSSPCPRRGAEAYIVSVVDHPYLATLLPLWLTMSSYPSTTPVVLAVRHASAGKGCRPYLCQVGRTTAGVSTLLVSGQPYDRWRPPYLHPTSFPHRVDHVNGPVVQGREDMVGAEDEVLCLAAGPWWLWTSLEWELRNLNGAGADPTEQELGNSNGARADPTEQELGNLNSTRADITEQELENLNGAGADLTEQELGNLNGAGADPTEQELGNLNGTGVDLTEQELGNYGAGAYRTGQELGNLNGAGADPTEQELENLNLGFCREG
ncbi:hypothetical protein BHE74_00044171 [Ensete ventricosum]|nr:hypothetical protein BHE74_00044171 [Ensete ventricosum]